MTSKDSLATGIPATHIGPETGGTGSATSGEGSSAGVKENDPVAASGLEDAPPTPGAGEGREARSFEPRRAAIPPSNAPLDDAGQDLRDITDGKRHKDHDKH